MGYWIRGRIPDEQKNPITRALIAVYRPCLEWVLHRPKSTLVIAVLALTTTIWPLSRLGGEFLPRLDEGDLLYMPTALPGLSVGKAAELLQQTDRLIKTLPEVESVYGKAGRAETATDPAPLEMFETTIQFKPKSEWREPDKAWLVEQIRRTLVGFPGIDYGFTQPIEMRISEMLTGTRGDVAIKLFGVDLAQLGKSAQQVAEAVRKIDGAAEVIAPKAEGMQYLSVGVNRHTVGQSGMSVASA